MKLVIKVQNEQPSDKVRSLVKEHVSRAMPFTRHMFMHLGELRREVSVSYNKKKGLITARVKDDV